MIIQIKIENRIVELVLQKNKRVLDTHKFPDEFHLSEELLPEIDRLIKKNKLKPEDIKKITVKSDLGENFTTCRIAKAVANAWNALTCHSVTSSPQAGRGGYGKNFCSCG